MTIFAGVLLILNALYNAIVWPRFWKRVTTDPRARDEQGRPTAFYRVHAVLIIIALVLALISLIVGVVVLF